MISLTDFKERLDSDDTLVVIDVRTPAEFSQVHVPQARNVPLGSDLAEKLGPLKSKPIFLLCHSGGRAGKAAEQLGAAGFAQAVVIEGGTQAWIDAGLPVTRREGKIMSLERQVRIAAGTLVFIGVVMGHFVNHRFYLLSGFVGAGLVFAGITDYCGMGLLLAKLPWNNRPVS